MSQCTFWCSVLSDSATSRSNEAPAFCLNAPFGAQCFPTQSQRISSKGKFAVSMHLLVLSAFRRSFVTSTKRWWFGLNAPFGAQCFPTGGDNHGQERDVESQCTFWCSVLSDLGHVEIFHNARLKSQCTFWCSVLSDADIDEAKSVALSVSMHLLVLSAFRPSAVPSKGRFYRVSMHLLVLSAFRPVSIDA